MTLFNREDNKRDETKFKSSKAEANTFYSSCVITGLDSLVCDYAHIIAFNLSNTKEYKYDDISYESSNLIKLYTGLHRGFEIAEGRSPYWSLRIDDTYSQSGRIKCYVENEPFQTHKFLEHTYEGKEVILRKDSEPFIRIHYAIFRNHWYKEEIIIPTNISEELQNKLKNIVRFWKSLNDDKYKKYLNTPLTLSKKRSKSAPVIRGRSGRKTSEPRRKSPKINPSIFNTDSAGKRKSERISEKKRQISNYLITNSELELEVAEIMENTLNILEPTSDKIPKEEDDFTIVFDEE